MNQLPALHWLLMANVILVTFPARAQETKDSRISKVYPIAIFPFQERGRETKEMGGKVTDLLFADLVANPDLFLVDREELNRLIEELELSLSALTNPAAANKVGYLTGAKILVTGSVVQTDDSLSLIAKIIGTETSRVVGTSVKGNVRDDLNRLVEDLAAGVAKTVLTRADELVAKPITRADRLAKLQEEVGKGKRPVVFIDIPERHVGGTTIDPAAETEMTLLCTDSGFQVIDALEGSKSDADILITGEGFSEFAARHGNLISVKARLEVKAVDPKTGSVIAIDRHVSVGVDLSEQVAGKAALQDAAANIATRILPKIVGPAEKGGKEKKRTNSKRKD